MAMDKDKWLIGKDGLLYSKRPSKRDLFFKAQWTGDPFTKNYKVLGSIPFSELPEDIKTQIQEPEKVFA